MEFFCGVWKNNPFQILEETVGLLVVRITAIEAKENSYERGAATSSLLISLWIDYGTHFCRWLSNIVGFVFCKFPS